MASSATKSTGLSPFQLDATAGGVVESSASSDSHRGGGSSVTKKLSGDHGFSREMIDALCEGELVTGRDRIRPADVDRAYARAARPASQTRVPIGCVRGCVLGSGFFESVVGSRGHPSSPVEGCSVTKHGRHSLS
jgi:hypothetical protein